jgi:hypothetical protein
MKYIFLFIATLLISTSTHNANKNKQHNEQSIWKQIVTPNKTGLVIMLLSGVTTSFVSYEMGCNAFENTAMTGALCLTQYGIHTIWNYMQLKKEGKENSFDKQFKQAAKNYQRGQKTNKLRPQGIEILSLPFNRVISCKSQEFPINESLLEEKNNDIHALSVNLSHEIEEK